MPSGMSLAPAVFTLKAYSAEDLPRSKSDLFPSSTTLPKIPMIGNKHLKCNQNDLKHGSMQKPKIEFFLEDDFDEHSRLMLKRG